MIDRTTKLRWRRRWRQRKNQVEQLSIQTEDNIERHVFRRFDRLMQVRRFVFGWVVLCLFLLGGVFLQTSALSRYYKSNVPAPGGILTEGILGSFTNANPLYATGPVDGAVSKLVFAGLLKYDSDNKLVGDLAESWEIDKTEHIYTVKLRPNLQWQDGKQLTAQDVVFTYKTIQNPDAKSPLLSSWQGIGVAAKDARTVVFTLPGVLSSFQHGLTTGIIPEHLLGEIPAAQMRAIQFNTSTPIGSGPFKWSAIEVTNEEKAQQGRIGLLPNEYYHDGQSALQQYIIRYFTDQKQMVDSFEKNELTAMSGLDSVPDVLAKDTSVEQYSIPVTAQVMVFFKTSHEFLKDVKVRQALVQSADRETIVTNIGYPVVASNEPFLPGHPGYNKGITQLPYNESKAANLLDQAGWVAGKDGFREKKGKRLAFTLYSQSTSEYAYVTQKLQADWSKVGVKVDVLLQPDSDLQTTVTGHNYDALLYGISLGTDPDVYAYWGSTQADERAANRVNFSEYKSATADRALEAGRTRTDEKLRAVKYRPFLEVWRNDAPALALYQPRYLYITHGAIHGFDPHAINSASDRYANVVNWKIRETAVDKISID
jgi:peptide/nickel transport system substrate-binding protein